MLKEIKFEAKTDEEALEYAVNELKVNKEEITLEVLEETKGFLGIGRKALYKASYEFDIVSDAFSLSWLSLDIIFAILTCLIVENIKSTIKPINNNIATIYARISILNARSINFIINGFKTYTTSTTSSINNVEFLRHTLPLIFKNLSE
jgi:predicted RNA-binding protein Jag